VSGFADERMISVMQEHPEVDIVFMHNLGIPADRNRVLPSDCNVIEEILAWAQRRIETLEAKGIKRTRMVFDPGIGFGKTAEQSLMIIKNIERFHELGVRLLVGHSRKSFFGA